MLVIGCGYPDGKDFDWLRRDEAFKLACGRLPDNGVIFARSRLSRAGRMSGRCGRSSVLLMLWSISGAEVTRSHAICCPGHRRHG